MKTSSQSATARVPPSRILLRPSVLLMGLLLSACSSAPDRNDVPANTEFATRILADGTKMFTLKLYPEGGGDPDRVRQAQMQQRGRDGRAGRDCFPCGPGEGDGSAQVRGMREREVDLKNIATAMMVENQYCREGFVVLEQFQQERARVLRGECRDSADAGDRARFTQ